VRKLYLASYANSKYWMDYEDFSFYRMDVVDVYYVGGFGVMGWIPAPEYAQARPDPLADAATEILQHMNTDHKDALILLAREFAGIEAQEAAMTSVDRLGFHLRLKTHDGVRGSRIAFLCEVVTRKKPERSSSRCEICHQREGRRGHLIFNLNVVDKRMIRLLYEASQAGVRVDLLVHWAG
jgi:hypothetical protein